MKIVETNCETGEVIEREMTEAELKEVELSKIKLAEEAAKVAAKETARQALLDKLGITADEAKLLLG